MRRANTKEARYAMDRSIGSGDIGIAAGEPVFQSRAKRVQAQQTSTQGLISGSFAISSTLPYVDRVTEFL